MFKKIAAALFCFLCFSELNACPFCNKQIRQAIFDSTFYPNLFSMLLAFIILAVIVLILYIITTKWHRLKFSRATALPMLTPVPLTTASVVLGIGLGGFADGIFLHQILQWHEMLSAKIPPVNYVNKSVNMFWDGIFHAFTFIVTVTGSVLLWKILQRKNTDRSGKLFAGGLLAGWGIFNLVEGIVDHQILQLHNVREIASDHQVWNIGFLLFSLVLMFMGSLLIIPRFRSS